MKRNPCTMVVADDRELLKLLTHILKQQGYRTVTAHDSSVALPLLEEHKPDLIILDIIMPELNGFQVIDLVRQHSNAPIIVLSGKSEVTFLREALAAGADDYLKRPFSTMELLARIRAKLRRVSPRVTQPKKEAGPEP